MDDSTNDLGISPGDSGLDAPRLLSRTPSPTTEALGASAPGRAQADRTDRSDGDAGSDAGDDTERELAEFNEDGTPRTSAKKRRRGSRGGKSRKKPAAADGSADDVDDDVDGDDVDVDVDVDSSGSVAASPQASRPKPQPRTPRPPKAPKPQPDVDEGALIGRVMPDMPEMPDVPREGRATDTAAATALVAKAPAPRPRIGDTRPAIPPPPGPAVTVGPAIEAAQSSKKRSAKPERKPKPLQPSSSRQSLTVTPVQTDNSPADISDGKTKRGRRKKDPTAAAAELEADLAGRRRGRERNGRPVGRYMMAVQVREGLTQVAVLEGRNLIEHYVSRPADDVAQIHGNIYLGRVQNILPGMEAAFVDIATPKNAVLYRGDVQFDQEDVVERSDKPRIEQMLRSRQLIICQVTKNPIGMKGARLTQEVSIPGRFVVLIPNSNTFGISKRLPDDERKRLRGILDRVKPGEHGLIVRTAAETASEQELRGDVLRLVDTWNKIEEQAAIARKANKPALLYREPELAVRVIREEFNAEYRTVSIDDKALFEEVRAYVASMNPELADRVEFHDAAVDGLPLYERHHVHEQIHKALDRKVWLKSGGSLIIDHTEAMTVIDVNTGKNVGKNNLEETVFHNNLEAADEIARQLRLRDIGGIIVIDFIDMEIRENRKRVVDSFRAALSRDKTRSQVFEISELGLVEMTRKRIGEGLLTSFAEHCPNCAGRGVVVELGRLE